MGMRIHRAMGWGLDLSQIEGASKEALNNWGGDSIWEGGLPDAVWQEAEVMATQIDDMPMMLHASTKHETYAMMRTAQMYEFVRYDSEFAFEDKLLLTLPCHKQWHRYDDDIDYRQAMHLAGPDGDMTDVMWSQHPSPIYPYYGYCYASETHPLGYDVRQGQITLGMKAEERAKLIANIPYLLWYVLRHLRIVPEERTTEVLLTARPTIMTWWS